MKVVDFDGQEPGSPAARLPASSPEPAAAPRPGSPSGYGSPGPSSPKKAYSVKFTASPAGFASAGAAASLEHAGARSELGEELARRLDKIDSKLDWLVSRSRATGTADIQRTRSTGSAHGFPAFADADRAAPPAAHAETPYSAADSGPRTSVTALRSATDGGGPLTSVTALRGVADVGPLISVEPPSAVGSAPSPRGPRPHLMVQRRMSSQEDSADRLAGEQRRPSWGLQPRVSRAGSEGREPGSPGVTPRASRASRRASALIPNLSISNRRSATLARTVTRSTAWTASGRSASGGSSSGSVPDMFKNQFVARRMYEKSESKDLDHMQKYIQTLPTAMTKRRSKAVDYVWTVLDDPGSSTVAWWTAMLLQILVLLSVLGTFLQTVEEPPLRGWSAAIVELVFDAVFLLEICIRWCSAPSKVNFAFATHTWIDIAAASAIAVRAAVGFVLPESQDDAVSIFLLCFVPIIRLLKILRHFETFNVLIQAVKITMEALPMLLYAVALITMTFATLIYLVEPELFESPFRAVWFCLVTVTTVGYGDYAPTTTAGITIVMILIVSGVILMAVPIGIIGNTFNEVWNTRDYSLLLSKTRTKMQQWGYTANDIPTLFKLVDYDENGQLELDEFCQLVKEMKIGLSEDRVIALFEHMDKDGSGALDAAEFALAIFPHKYVENFGHARAASREVVRKMRESTFSALTNFTVHSRSFNRLSPGSRSVSGLPDSPG